MGMVLTLAMITLISVMVIAFFYQVKNSFLLEHLNAQKNKTKLISFSAKDYVISQFIHEITDPKKSYQPNSSKDRVFIPINPTNAVPIRSLSDKISHNDPYFYNLIRQSVPESDPNASSHSTSSSSQNNFYLTPKRWNTPQLLTGDGFTENSQLPHWIYVDLKKGIESDLNQSDHVVGRFAYNVYNVGTLMDINVAGHPSDLPRSSLLRIKNSVAGADLTQLPGVSASAVNRLIQFRNPDYNSFNYEQIVESLQQTGFMNPHTTNSVGTVKASFNNNFFSSRQDLIDYIRTQNPDFSQALPYLTTYSRDNNQPMIVPFRDRPKILSDTGSSPYTNYKGGNDGYRKDDEINPVFPAIFLTKNISRYNGTPGKSGEPLVNRKFPLERLAWITCKGPSALLTDSDPVVVALTKNRVRLPLIHQGSPENIRNYFGLVWDAQNHLWIYAPGAVGAPVLSSASPGPILTLSQIQDREPNFIELLKATIHAGSVGKSFGNNSDYFTGSPATTPPPQYFSHLKDSSIDYQIIQMAGNMIDQADPDSYPTRIQFVPGVNQKTLLFAGVEDLPYLYRIKNIAILVRPPNPLGTGVPTDKSPYGTYPVPAASVTDPGCGVMMVIPEIWNPHDQNRSTSSNALRPGASQLRVVADNTDPVSAQSGNVGAATVRVANNLGGTGSPASMISSYSPGLSVNPSTSALVFGDSNGELFREPTALRNPNIPAGSGLRTASVIPASAFSNAPLPSVPGTSLNNLSSPPSSGWSLRDYRVSSSVLDFIGIYLGYFPLIKVDPNVPNVVGDGQYDPGNLSGQFKHWDNAILDTSRPYIGTFRVQCVDPFGNWIDYDVKQTVTPQNGNSPHRLISAEYYPTLKRTLNENFLGRRSWGFAFDPRSSRFQMNFSWIGGSQIIPDNPFFDTDGSMIDYTTWYQKNNVLGTQRPQLNVFTGQSIMIRFSPGSGLVASANGGQSGTAYYDSLICQNNPNANDGIFYYSDPDGIVRRAMGAYTPPGYDSVGKTSSSAGLPLITATTNLNSTPAPTTQSRSRPRILNRPFRSVAELGYVFSDTPWKNIDFFTPESGNSALLDLFCIYEINRKDQITAGKINLNTPHQAILQSILKDASRDVGEESSSPMYSSLPPLTKNESEEISKQMISWSQRTPWTSIGDFVGRPLSASTYAGFSKQLTSAFDSLGTQESKIIQRFREAPIRALADISNTSTWNIMIDVIVQNGGFDQKRKLREENNFEVQGQERYWIHVAISRITGEIIDQKIESVYE